MSTPAGWYPDPHDASQQRYWNGASWTAHQTPRPPGPVAAVPTSGRATTALVLGLMSLISFGFVLGIPAMVIGRRAQRDIRESQGRLGGEGLATAGFWTGLVGTIWSLLAFVIVVAIFIFGVALFSQVDTSCSQGGVPSQCP
jgi:hypothetical protein